MGVKHVPDLIVDLTEPESKVRSGDWGFKNWLLEIQNGNRYLRRHGRRNDRDFTLETCIPKSRRLQLMSSIFDINLRAVNFFCK